QELFQRQVAAQGDSVALVHKGQPFTYKQLDTVSAQLCNYLKEKYQVQPGELIGVKLHRSEWLIISLLSV
ncbi:AMP-binding protein, partial [Chitinophaga varians]|uniref:AMP-binding protein n=1 Tax=Chitinophaga varians TaxID=2202339 RepID=UPI00165EF7B5